MASTRRLCPHPRPAGTTQAWGYMPVRRKLQEVLRCPDAPQHLQQEQPVYRPTVRRHPPEKVRAGHAVALGELTALPCSLPSCRLATGCARTRGSRCALPLRACCCPARLWGPVCTAVIPPLGTLPAARRTAPD